VLRTLIKIGRGVGMKLKDGVLSAFEHHCAGSYNLPFTGFILIPIGADLLCIITKHYPMRKKFVNWNFERVS
jgi:hypothetical protein